tara:strand:+ start:201 stop:1025 length:825 start_codon:yes stop_codon:yes gene_type:complete
MSKKTNGNLTTILGQKTDFANYKAVKVLLEKNLTKFNLLDDNRDIDPKHVAMLVVSMQRYGQLMPIVVNENLDVIEGQHRLKACMELKIPVAYIISVKSSSKDIAIMNNSQKGWKNRDYLKHFSHKNHSNSSTYKKIENFFKSYPLPFPVGIMLLSGNVDHALETGNTRGPMPKFRDGSFKIVDIENAELKAGQLLKLKGIVPQLIQIRKFCVAFLRCSKISNFKISICYEAMKKYHNRFGHPGNQQEWTDEFCNVYSYKQRKENKISPRKEGM